MLSCQRCKQSTNGPQAFLLTCRGCNKTWHHRCHMPPVEDAELFQRLRATNDQDMANGIYAWTCRRCKKATSETPTTVSSGSSGGLTLSFVSLKDKKNITSRNTRLALKDTTSAPAASVAPPEAEAETSTVVDALNDRERHKTSDRKESVDNEVKRTPIDKRETMAARKLSHVQTQPSPTKTRDMDLEMTTKPTPQEEKRSAQNFSKIPSRQVSGARKVASVDTVQDLSKPHSHRVSAAWKVVNMDSAPPTHTKDDVEMTDDTMISTFSGSTRGSTLQVPENDDDDGLKSTEVQLGVRAANLSSKQEQEVRLADEVAIQPKGNQGVHVDDDPEDLYGPPVERRVVRILPSLAEELREQQRQAAIQKEKKVKRAYLASDWIFAKHANDPLWKEIPTANVRQRPRKAVARKLGENGLDVNELVGCFTAASWVREHLDKTRMYACI